MRGKPPTFESFSKEYNEENQIFRRYCISRATANDEPTITQFMILYCVFKKGASLMHYMLKQEGIGLEAIDMINEVLDQSEQETIQDLKDLGM